MIVGSVVAVFLVTILLYAAYRDRTKDSDGDGLTDYDEVNTYNTVEWSNDTDCDGLDDYDEVIVYHTDPHNPDTDGDYVSDDIEIKAGSDPLKIDTDGGGITDFDELYTYPNYGMDLKNPKDDHDLIARIPNIVARHWDPLDGGTKSSYDKYIEISMMDPLVQWYAKRAEIKWPSPSEGFIGRFYVDGKPMWNGLGEPNERSLDQPSYYFTHDRTGSCVHSSIANAVILELMGNKTKIVEGDTPSSGHQWAEVLINGKVYVANFNEIAPREGFYERNNWIPYSYYDPNWYLR